MVLKRLLKNVFYDQDGKLVIVQAPNWSGALTIFFILVKWRSLAAITGLYWAYLEIRYGVNYFRRGLGAFVVVMILMQLTRNIKL